MAVKKNLLHVSGCKMLHKSCSWWITALEFHRFTSALADFEISDLMPGPAVARRAAQNEGSKWWSHMKSQKMAKPCQTTSISTRGVPTLIEFHGQDMARLTLTEPSPNPLPRLQTPRSHASLCKACNLKELSEKHFIKLRLDELSKARWGFICS
jgi:hypothetical protein